MARPLRIQFPGAFYHVTSRGNERKAIFGNDRDRQKIPFLPGISPRELWCKSTRLLPYGESLSSPLGNSARQLILNPSPCERGLHYIL